MSPLEYGLGLETRKVKGQAIIKQTRGIASLQERVQPSCGCGRATYRLNAEHAEMCKGCDEDVVLCECNPLQKIGTQLIG